VNTSEIKGTEVKNQIKFDPVETSQMGFYTIDKGKEIKSLPSGNDSDEEYILVFGVKINTRSKI